MEERCYRNEYKHLISQGAKYGLSSRLKKILPRDSNCRKGSYKIKSLYFDTIYDDALKEKLSGVSYREKFRIRCYNNDHSYIKLEKKVKEKDKGYKLYTRITKEEAQRIILGDIEFLKDREESLLKEFYIKTRIKTLEPKIIIEYEREAYVYRPGNTRVTLDFNIRSSVNSVDFLNSNLPLLDVEPNQCVLEVKFDNFIPDLIKDLVQVNETSSTAHSKYAIGRMNTNFM